MGEQKDGLAPDFVYATLLEHNTKLHENQTVVNRINAGISDLIGSVNKYNGEMAARLEKAEQRIAELEKIIISSRNDELELTSSDYDT